MDWISVSKPKKIRKNFTHPSFSQEEIVKKIQDFFSSKYFESVVLYGSVTNSSFSKTSDVDVMIFSKERISHFELKNLKIELQKEIGRKVDLVCMLITNKFQDQIFHNEIFLEQVREEGKTIFGSHFKDFIEKSIKLGKF